MSEGGIVSKLLWMSLFSCILLPPARLVEGMPSVRLEEVLVVGFFFIYAILKGKQFTRLFSPLTFVDLCFALLLLSVSLSTYYGWLVLNQTVIIRDYFELVKIFKYYLFYRLSVFAVIEGFLKPKELYNALMVFGAVAAIVTLMQFFDLLAVNSWLSPLYEGGELRGDPFLHRSIGTFGNPNISGYFFAVLLVLGFSKMIVNSKDYLKSPHILVILIMAAAFLTTESRTAVVALPVGILAVALQKEVGMKVRDCKERLLNLLVVAGLIISLGVVIYVLPLEYLHEIKEAFHARSMLARYEVWWDAYDTAVKSPFLGWGPAKDNMPMGIDNEYLLQFRRYGLLGLVLLMTMYLSLVRIAHMLCRRYGSKESTFLSLFMVGTVFVVLVVGLTNSAFNNLRFMPVFWTIAGSTIGWWKYCLNKENSGIHGT